MPTFDYYHKSAFVRNKYGKRVKRPPSYFLQVFGMAVPVTIGIDDDLKNRIAILEKDVPPVIESYALIDTGADCSCIDIGLAKRLQLPTSHEMYVSTPSHASYKVNTYSGASISIKQDDEVIFEPEFLSGSPLEVQGLGIILGRDFLRHCELYYNGMTSNVKLSTPKRKIIT